MIIGPQRDPKEEILAEYEAACSDDQASGRRRSGFTAWTPRSIRTRNRYIGFFVERSSSRSYEIALFSAGTVAPDGTRVVTSERAATETVLTVLLVNAYLRTGTCRVRFRGSAEGSLEGGYEPVVPDGIRRLCLAFGLFVSGVDVISDGEGQALLFALAGFDDETKALIETKEIDRLRAALLVTRGVWTKESFKQIAFGCRWPNRTIRGGWNPISSWVRFSDDQIVLRWAVMGELFDAFIRNVDALHESVSERETTIDLISEACRGITVSTPVSLVVRGAAGPETIRVAPGKPFLIYLCPRDNWEYELDLLDDLRDVDPYLPTLLVVTKDVDYARQEYLAPAYDELSRLGKVRLFVTNESVDDLDLEIRDRLRMSEATTRPLPPGVD